MLVPDKRTGPCNRLPGHHSDSKPQPGFRSMRGLTARRSWTEFVLGLARPLRERSHPPPGNAGLPLKLLGQQPLLRMHVPHQAW
jgi:hypothetical protein